MNRIAFLFPGQGSQYPGMGKDFFESSEESRSLYRQAQDMLNIKLEEKIFNGEAESLEDTSLSQLAIFLTSLSCYQRLNEANIFPEVMAGHSLGEYSALTAAGAFSLPDGLKLIQKRSFWMAEASREHPGKMAAIIGLPAAEIQKICQAAESKGVISIANFNSPNQTVISGESLAVDEGVRLSRRRGARRVVLLRVSGPFHSELMAPIGKKLRGLLDSLEVKPPQVPIVSNVNAHFAERPAQIKENLIKQLSQPVRWTESIENLITQGFNIFVEVGPRRVLSGLLSQGNKGIVSLNVEDEKSLERTKRELKSRL